MSIHAKMLEFHKQFRGAEKTGYNTHFKQAYFKLDDITAAITPILNELGVYVYSATDGGKLTTSVIDVESGECNKSHFPLPESQNPQVHGSSLTYGMRYNLCALFGIAETDDDGEAAAINQPKAVSDKTAIILRDLADGNDERTAFLDKRLNTMTEDAATTIVQRWTVANEKEKAA